VRRGMIQLEWHWLVFQTDVPSRNRIEHRRQAARQD
jgi:hypothetical protein